MRNLKRALSLALASIMLLGMMVTGAGAVESIGFTDADEIVNQEAAAVTSGLGIFDGYTDGSFGPERPVTRAEMAVIICKLLNGAHVDQANFAGISKFNDVPSWAEGYVNYCASMEIVKGVGDGKFDPNSTVTTVQAATMLLKALGYYTEEDQLKDDWKTVVTGRATSLKLYGDLSLGVDEPLTRDNVAELVFHTIQAQRVAYDDNRNLYVNNRNRDEVVTNGTKDWQNTLAENTFDMWIVDGVVTANSCTDDTLSETVNNAPRTNVMFHDAKTIEGYVYDYPCQAYQGKAVNGGYPFEYTTGLDMIGHAARVYYKIEQNAPVVYAIVDRATKVATISYNKNNTDLANAANQAGFRRNTILNKSLDDYKLNYSWDVTVGSKVNLAPAKQPAHSLILISNSSDYTVDVVIALDQYLDTVRDVFTRNEETDYDMTTANGTRLEVPHDEFAKGDYVIVTDVGNEGKVLNFSKPAMVTANITKITGISDADATVKAITADGTEYKGSPVWVHKRTNVELDNTTDFEAIKTIGEATLILDSNEADARCVGLAQPEGTPNYVYAAQFGVRHENVSSLNTKEKLSVLLYFPDGTSSAYLVNTSVEKVGGKKNLFYKYNPNDTVLAGDVAKLNTYSATPYTGVKGYAVAPTTNGTAALTNLTAAKTGLGIYEASVRADGTVVLMDLGANSANRPITAKARLTKGLSTLVVTAPNPVLGTNMTNGSSVTVDDTGLNYFYQTNKTVYYYVNGKYGDNLEVVPFVGHDNAVSFTHGDKGDDNIDNEFVQLFSGNKTYAESAIQTRREVSAMMVYGVEVNSDATVYWYLEGNYHITTKDGVEVANGKAAGDEQLAITFDVYKEADGELYKHTINNKGKYYTMDEAQSIVSSIETGLKKLSSDGLTSVASTNAENQKLTPENTSTLKNRTVVINAIVRHMNGYGNIFTDVEEVGGITTNVKVIDATGRDRVLFSSVADIEAHWRANDKVTICYTYSTTGSDAYKVNTIIVSGYEPGALSGTGDVLGTATLWAETGTNYMAVRLYNEYDAKNIVEVRDSIAAAYQAAGYTVTAPVFLSTTQWGLTISGNGLANPVNITGTNGQTSATASMGTSGVYIPVTVNRVAKVVQDNKATYWEVGKTASLTFPGVSAAFTKVGSDNATGSAIANNTWTRVITNSDLSKPIVVSAAVEVKPLPANMSGYAAWDNTSEVIPATGGTSVYVPVNATLNVTNNEGSGTWSMKVTEGTGDSAKVTLYDVKAGGKFEHKITAGPVQVEFDGEKALVTLYAGPGIEVTYLEAGKTGEANYKTLDGGMTGNSVQLAPGWTLISPKNEGEAKTYLYTDKKIDQSFIQLGEKTPTSVTVPGTEGTNIQKSVCIYTWANVTLPKGLISIKGTLDGATKELSLVSQGGNTGETNAFVIAGTQVTVTGYYTGNLTASWSGSTVNGIPSQGNAVPANVSFTMPAENVEIKTVGALQDGDVVKLNDMSEEAIKNLLTQMGFLSEWDRDAFIGHDVGFILNWKAGDRLEVRVYGSTGQDVVQPVSKDAVALAYNDAQRVATVTRNQNPGMITFRLVKTQETDTTSIFSAGALTAGTYTVKLFVNGKEAASTPFTVAAEE